MPINPAIAMGVRGIELQDPLAQYGRVAAIQQAQQQNMLAQQQLAQAQRAEQQQNALSAAYQAAYDPATGGIDANRLRSTLVSSGFGSQIPTVEKTLGELETQRLTREKLTGEIAKGKGDQIDAALKRSRGFLDTLDPMDPNAPAQYMAWHEANHRDPVLGPLLASRGITADQSRARIEQAIAAGPAAFAQLIAQSKLGTDKFMELNKPVDIKIDRGGRTDIFTRPGLGTTPTLAGSYADVPLPSDVAQQKKEIAREGRSTQSVVNVHERAEAGARGKMLVDQYADISKAAGLAVKTLPTIEANLGALNDGLTTGFGTDAKAAAARVLGALGVADAEKFATSAQSFQSNAIGAVLQKQLEQKGPQTEADARRIEQIGAELSKTKGANEFILSMAKEQLRRDVEQRNFYDSWYRKNKTYDGAEDAWFSGEGGRSLFERPALQRYAPKRPPDLRQIPGRQAPATPSRTVVRTGTLNGRRVVEYSDGKTEYAD